MFGFLKGKQKSLIGMDIGSNVVKCLRLDLSSDRPVITHFAMADLPPEAIVDGEIMDRELVIEAIRSAAEEAGIPDEPVASAVAGRAVDAATTARLRAARPEAKRFHRKDYLDALD